MRKKKKKEIVHKLNSLQFEHLLGGYILGQLALGMGIFKDKQFDVARGKVMADGSWKGIVHIRDK